MLIFSGLLVWTRALERQRQILPLESQKQEYDGTQASEVNGNHIVLETDERYQQEEEDGSPIARGEIAGELEANPAR